MTPLEKSAWELGWGAAGLSFRGAQVTHGAHGLGLNLLKKTWAWAEKVEITKEKALQNYTIFECKKVVLLFYRNSPFEAWVNWITISVATLKIGRSYLCKDS